MMLTGRGKPGIEMILLSLYRELLIYNSDRRFADNDSGER